MKLISTLFSGEEIEVTLTIQSQNKRDKNGNDSEGPMIMHYRSQIGNESLIFSPKVAIIIKNKDRNNQMDAWIAQTMFYRFVAALTGVYSGLQKDKLYHSEGDALFMDQKVASQVAQKMSLFRNSITIKPTIIVPKYVQQQVKGIAFLIDGKVMGSMPHNEALALIEQLDHFDITTFSLLAGIVDEMETMNSKMDYMMSTLMVKMDTIEKLIKSSQSISSKRLTRSLPDMNTLGVG